MANLVPRPFTGNKALYMLWQDHPALPVLSSLIDTRLRVDTLVRAGMITVYAISLGYFGAQLPC